MVDTQDISADAVTLAVIAPQDFDDFAARFSTAHQGTFQQYLAALEVMLDEVRSQGLAVHLARVDSGFIPWCTQMGIDPDFSPSRAAYAAHRSRGSDPWDGTVTHWLQEHARD
jgi:hypothetical protein